MIRHIALLLLVLFCTATKAQDKKVGLVLSGGGASGLAHVGVLKALEENEIQIDYIVGTSIGALVGGYYASGYSPEQIERIVTSDVFRNAADGLDNFEHVFYFKQSNAEADMISWRFDLDSILGTNLPNNFVSSVPIDLGLMRYFAQANAVSGSNFDSLMIPFRCLAANITTKSEKIFDSGQMASAIRASMTYPFFLAPITIDGGVMLDGGLFNNFPYDIMCEEFEVDFIIASNVSSKLSPPTEDNLVSQIKNILIHESNYNTDCSDGIIIQSEVEDIGTFNFNQNEEVIQRGYESTITLIDSIKEKLKDNSSFTIPEKRERFNKKKPELLFDEVNISGIHPIHEKYFRKELYRKKSFFHYDQFERSYMKLASDEKIRSIYPTTFFDAKDSLFKLDLNVKKEKPFRAKFGGVISSKPFSTGFFELEYQALRATGLKLSGNVFFGNFYSSAEGRIRWDIPYRVPFFLEANYTINQYDYFNSRSTFVEEDNTPYILNSENYVEGQIGLPLAMNGRILLGGSYTWQKFNYYQSANFERGDTSDLTEFEGYSTFVKFQMNTLNHKQYATKGSRLEFMVRNIYGDERTTPGTTALDKQYLKSNRSWWVVKGSYEDYFLERNSFRLGLLAEGVYTDHPFFQNYTATALSIPVFEPIPENKTLFQEQYRSLSYIGAGLKTIYTINDKIDFRFEVYVFQPYEAISADQIGKASFGEEIGERSFIGTFTSVYHSRVGPLAFSVNYYDDTSEPISILFHFGYVLFNKKAFD